MSRHAAHRRARPRRTPALAAVAATAAALLVATTVDGTLAFWSDTASLETAAVSSATLDLTLDGNLAGAAANGSAWTDPSFGIAAMLPGESRATAVTLRNDGTAPLVYAVTGQATGALTPGLRFSISVGAAASNTGSQSAGNRTGTCTGGSTLVTDATLTSTTATLVPTDRSLAPGAGELVCVVLRLDPDAPNTLQGTSASALLTFAGRQAGAG